ncbi:MAG: hypothetical protein IJB82_04730 [Bacilli bacterium]|nr:hypothetical protein [Bacilli bacterium]
MNKYERNIDYDKIYEESIILIGPLNAGKSTITKELEKRFEMPSIHFDNMADIYMPMFGFEKKEAVEKYKSNNIEDYIKYKEPFRFKFVSHMITSLDRPTILDFGAEDTLFFGENREIIKEMLSRFKNVIQILPTSNPSESLKILEDRWQSDRSEYKIGNIYDKVNWYLLNDSLNNDLATITVYTENKSPEEITDEIIELINERKHIM